MIFSEQRALQVGAEEIGRRGREIYETTLREKLDTPENLGRFLAIDTDTGEYAIGGRLDAAESLQAQNPDSLIYLIKIGYPATVTMAGRLLPSPRR